MIPSPLPHQLFCGGNGYIPNYYLGLTKSQTQCLLAAADLVIICTDEYAKNTNVNESPNPVLVGY